MSEKDDVYYALMEARRVADSLSSWVRSADARDSVRSSQSIIEQGIKAWERISSDLREGRKHIEPPEDYVHTSCYCNTPDCSPPCSFCESGAGNELDEFDNPLDGRGPCLRKMRPAQRYPDRWLAMRLSQSTGIFGEDQMSWKNMQSAPRDGTEILLRYPKQGNVKHLALYDKFSGMWTNKGAPVFAVEQGCEWAPIPTDDAPAVANAAPLDTKWPSEELIGAVARGWCSDASGGKEMDSDLAFDIATSVHRYLQSQAYSAAQQADSNQQLSDDLIKQIASEQGMSTYAYQNDPVGYCIDFARAIEAAAAPNAQLVEALQECSRLESAEEIRSIARAALAAAGVKP